MRAAETNHLATLRLHLKGSKKIVTVDTLLVVNFLQQEKKTTPADSVALKDAYAWLAEATTEKAKELFEFAQSRSTSAVRPPIFVAEVQPSDMLYLPPAYCYFECIDDKDCVGARIQLLCQSHLDSLERLAKFLEQNGKPNEQLRTVVDSLLMSA